MRIPNKEGSQHRSEAFPHIGHTTGISTSARIRRWTTNRGFQKLFYTRSQAFRDFAVSIVGRNYRRPTPSDKAAKHLVSKPDSCGVPLRPLCAIAVGHPNDSSNAITTTRMFIRCLRCSRERSYRKRRGQLRRATLFKLVRSHHPSMM